MIKCSLHTSSGLFDKNMSPLAVSQEQLFGFANKLFNQSFRVDQERVLQWLQVRHKKIIFSNTSIILRNKTFFLIKTTLYFSNKSEKCFVSRFCVKWKSISPLKVLLKCFYKLKTSSVFLLILNQLTQR